MVNLTPPPSASLQSAIEMREGEVVAFLIHDQVTGNGANTEYRITRIVFARLMGVKLQGSSNSRGLWLQPAVYTGAGVRTSPAAPNSNGQIGKLILAR